MIGQVERFTKRPAAEPFAKIKSPIGKANGQTEYGRPPLAIGAALKHLFLVRHKGQFVVRCPADRQGIIRIRRGLPRTRVKQHEAIGVIAAADCPDIGRGRMAKRQRLPAISDVALGHVFRVERCFHGIEKVAGSANRDALDRQDFQHVGFAIGTVPGDHFNLDQPFLPLQPGQWIICAVSRDQPVARAPHMAAFKHEALFIGDHHAGEQILRMGRGRQDDQRGGQRQRPETGKGGLPASIAERNASGYAGVMNFDRPIRRFGRTPRYHVAAVVASFVLAAMPLNAARKGGEADPGSEQVAVPDDSKRDANALYFGQLALVRSDVALVAQGFDDNGIPVLDIALQPDATKRLEAETLRLLDTDVTISLGSATLISARLVEPITEGKLRLSGRFSVTEVLAMAGQIICALNLSAEQLDPPSPAGKLPCDTDMAP